MKLTANRKTPSIPTIGGDVVSHTRALESIRDAIQIHERRTSDVLSSFVRVSDLISIGLAEFNGGELVAVLGADAATRFPQRFGATWVRNGSAIATPVNDVFHYFPADCTITSAVVLTAGGPGDCVIDVRKDVFLNFPPDGSDSICGGNELEVASGNTLLETTFTGWDLEIVAGDVLSFSLVSSATFDLIQVYLFAE